MKRNRCSLNRAVIDLLPFVADRLKKRQSYQHESVMDTIMVSIDNLEESQKQRFKSLVVFIDNNSLPKDVSHIFSAKL